MKKLRVYLSAKTLDSNTSRPTEKKTVPGSGFWLTVLEGTVHDQLVPLLVGIGSSGIMRQIRDAHFVNEEGGRDPSACTVAREPGLSPKNSADMEHSRRGRCH